MHQDQQPPPSENPSSSQPRPLISHYIVTVKGKPCGAEGKILSTAVQPPRIFQVSNGVARNRSNRTKTAHRQAESFIRRTRNFAEQLRLSMLSDWPKMQDIITANGNDYRIVPYRDAAPTLERAS